MWHRRIYTIAMAKRNQARSHPDRSGERTDRPIQHRTVAAIPATGVTDEIAVYDMLSSSGTTGRPKSVKPAFKNEPLGVPPPLLDLL
jgi:hypothetical protein